MFFSFLSISLTQDTSNNILFLLSVLDHTTYYECRISPVSPVIEIHIPKPQDPQTAIGETSDRAMPWVVCRLRRHTRATQGLEHRKRAIVPYVTSMAKRLFEQLAQ